MVAAKLSKPVEIEVPEKLTRRERARDTIVTGLMWMVYFYLWLPLASLLAWLLGFDLAYDVMVRAGGWGAFKAELLLYSSTIMIIVAIVIGWSLSNLIRFRDKDRRGGGITVGDDELVRYFGVSLEQLKALRAGRIVRLQLDESGRVADIDTELKSYVRTPLRYAQIRPVPDQERSPESEERQL